MNSNFGIYGRVIAMKSMLHGIIKVASSSKTKKDIHKDLLRMITSALLIKALPFLMGK